MKCRILLFVCMLMGCYDVMGLDSNIGMRQSVSMDKHGRASLPHKRQWPVYSLDFYVSGSNYDYSDVTADIVGDAADDYEKIKRIYLWVCDNIKYDNSLSIRTADKAWDKRTAVCQGFCELMYRMAKTQDIKLTLVNGKAQLPSKSIMEHVWLIANIDTTGTDSVVSKTNVFAKKDYKRILMDPTWGASAYRMAEFNIPERNPLQWFDVDPEEMLKTHFPSRKKYEYPNKKSKPFRL